MSESFLKAVQEAPEGSTILWDETNTVVEVIEPGLEPAAGEHGTMKDSDADTTEKVERTDTGYRLTVESTRGTGTRDQDKVKVEARTETLDKLKEQQLAIRSVVKMEMEQRRLHKPDQEESGE